jgi:hypothetical protein
VQYFFYFSCPLSLLLSLLPLRILSFVSENEMFANVASSSAMFHLHFSFQLIALFLQRESYKEHNKQPSTFFYYTTRKIEEVGLCPPENASSRRKS